MYKLINSIYDKNLEEVKQRFQGDVASHELAVLRDDGLYRHVRFQRRDGDGKLSWNYRFDLVTWPMHLAITGDMHGHMFARTEDMFSFFREAGGYDGYINPGYWAEKIVSSREGLKRYNEELFEATVRGVAAEREEDFPGLRDAVQEEFFGHWAEDRGDHEVARRSLHHFKFPSFPAKDTDPQFEFTETWEYDFTDWDFHYLWCCHAIAWGIDQYDNLKKMEKVNGAAAT